MLESEPCYDALEDLIASDKARYQWLHLFCLQSLTSNGIKTARCDLLQREVVQMYGYEYIMVLNDVEKAGLCKSLWSAFLAIKISFELSSRPKLLSSTLLWSCCPG